MASGKDSAKAVQPLSWRLLDTADALEQCRMLADSLKDFKLCNDPVDRIQLIDVSNSDMRVVWSDYVRARVT